jgi:hypothetical protein
MAHSAPREGAGMKYVEVTWLDSYTIPSDEWMNKEQMDADIQDVVMVSVGYLYRITRNYIVLVNTRSSVPEYWGGIVIVKKSILKAVELE